jgi:GTP-binding protein EngB required for normal cell division
MEKMLFESEIASSVSASLPSHLTALWERLCASTIANQNALQLCVAGEFAVGKSTLINQLLGKDLIATDVGETTAIPVLLSYAAEASAWRVDQKKEKHSISWEMLKNYSKQPASHEEILLLFWPAPWLEGFFLMDIPGLGGTDEAKQAVVRRYLSLSDVVLYLVDGRGVTKRDIEVLRELVSLGKTIHLLVARWDQAEEAAQQGERLPDLEGWAAILLEKIGRKIEPLPVSKKGHNLDLLREWLQQIKQKQTEIRASLFIAQAKPLLEEALMWLEKESAILATQTAEELEKKEEELRDLQFHILKEKSRILEEREASYPAVEQKMDTLSEETRSALAATLVQHTQAFLETMDGERWSLTQKEMNQALREAISSFAVKLMQLDQETAKHFDQKISLPNELTLSLPQREQINVNDLLDVGAQAALESQLREILDHLPTAIDNQEDIAQKEQALTRIDQLRKELVRDQQQVTSMELPRVWKEVPGHRIGSTVGRVLGGIADIALLFVAPATAATKAASLIGQGAKALNLSVNAAKIANTAKQILDIHRAVNLPKNPFVDAFLRKKEAESVDLSQEQEPPEKSLLMKGAAVLEKISVSYWSEKLFGIFDQPTEYLEEVDPQAVAFQQAKYEEFQQDLRKLQQEARQVQEDIEKNKENEYSLKKYAQRKEEIEKRLQQLKKQKAEALKEAEEARQERWKQVAEDTLKELQQKLLSSFSSQASGMKIRLFHAWKKHGQYVEQEAIQAHLTEVDTLKKALNAAPLQRQQQQEAIAQRKASLQQALQQIAP